MSNEELAILIKQGHTEHYNELWEQTKLFFYKYANMFYNRHTERCTFCGVTLNDLLQESFLALSDMVNAYDAEKSYKLLSYSSYAMKNRFNCALGCKKGEQRNPLNIARSIDEDIKTSKGENISIEDMIIDKDAERDYKILEEEIYINQLHNELENVMNNELDERQRDITKLIYYSGLTRVDTAKQYGISGEAVRQIERKAFRNIQNKAHKYKKLQEFRNDIISYHYTGLNSFRNCRASSEELYIERLENLERDLCHKDK